MNLLILITYKNIISGDIENWLVAYKPYFLYRRKGNVSWRIIRVEDKQPLSPKGQTIAVSYPYFTIIVHKKESQNLSPSRCLDAE